MKQLSAIFLVLAMVLALTACGKDDDRNNGGSPNRPDTNQSQNAPQDNGSGGSWQNGTTRPPSPAPEKTGEMGRIRCPARRRRDVWTAASCAAARSAPPPSARCWKTAMSTTATASLTTAKTPAGNIFAKTAAVSAKNADGRRENTFFALRPLAFLKKWAMIWEKEYVPPRAAEKRRVYYDKN